MYFDLKMLDCSLILRMPDREERHIAFWLCLWPLIKAFTIVLGVAFLSESEKEEENGN